MLGDMLFQAGDGHRHANCQLPLFGVREGAKANKSPHPVARRDELSFEPSMFETTKGQERKRGQGAPVENRERENGI